MRTAVHRCLLAALLAVLLVPAIAEASPRLRFDAGQVTAPLDPVPYFYVSSPGGGSVQNACQMPTVASLSCGAPENTHWDYADPAHPVFVDDDPSDSRCFWFSAQNPFGAGIPAAFQIQVSLLDPSGAVTPVSTDLPQLPGPFGNPQVSLGGSGPGAQSQSTCTAPRFDAPAPDSAAGTETTRPQRPQTIAVSKTRRPSKRVTPRRGAGGSAADKLCGAVASGVQCGPGNGRATSGGGEKVSHKGWPAVTGVLWKVLDSSSRNKVGGSANDELLGHHGSDHLSGGAGKDILWGDWDPSNNNTHQRDVLLGGAGNDFIYPSHGTTVVKAGAGNDYIWAFYGKGTIDCGPGHDIVHVRMNGAFKLHGCEVVKHFCQFGSDGHGGCLKPGEKAKRD